MPAWGDCTGNALSCLGRAECFGDDNYVTCVPPTSANSSVTYVDTSADSQTSSPSKGCSAKSEFC